MTLIFLCLNGDSGLEDFKGEFINDHFLSTT